MTTGEGLAHGGRGLRQNRRTAILGVDRAYWLIFLVALASAVPPRLIVFPLSVVHWDESIYTLVARDLVRGIMPLSGTFEHKPVMLYYIYAFPQLFFGESITSVRVLSIAVGVLGATLVGIVVRLTITRDAVVVATSIIVYAFLSALNRGTAAQPELIMNIFVLAVLILLHFQFRSPGPTTAGLISLGALWGLAFQVNYLSGFLILAFGLDYFWLSRRHLPTPTANCTFFVNGGVIAIGFFVTALVLLVPIVIWGDITTYFELQARFLTGYTLEQSWLQTFSEIPKVLRSYYLLIALIAVALCYTAVSYINRSDDFFMRRREIAVRVLIYVPFAIIAAIISKRVYAKYYLLILPFAVILLSIVLSSISRRKQLRTFCCAWLVVFSLLQLEQERVLFKHGIVGWSHLLHGAPVDVPDEIARDLSGVIAPDETVYVYDYQTIMYYLLKVIPPTHFASPVHHLEAGYAKAMGFDRGVEMNQILAHRPRFIITGSDPRDGQFGMASEVLAKRLASDYVLFRTYNDPIFHQTLQVSSEDAELSAYGEVNVYALER